MHRVDFTSMGDRCVYASVGVMGGRVRGGCVTAVGQRLGLPDRRADPTKTVTSHALPIVRLSGRHSRMHALGAGVSLMNA